MILNISISKQSDPSFSSKIDFNKFPLLIGRDEKNDIILPDPLKIISRKHAKIVNTEGILQLVDLESANFTYLNDQKLVPNEENAVKSGDKIKIGEYELNLEITLEKSISQNDEEKTMVFSSPFTEDAAKLAESIKSLSQKYILESSPMKAEMLKFSFLQNFNRFERNEPNMLLAEYFAEHFAIKQPVSLKEPKKVDIKITQPELASQLKADKERMTFSNMPEYSFSSHFTDTIDMLLDTFSKLIQGFLQFRQEFFGVTIYHTIPVGSLKELKEYLFNPVDSTEEEKKRLNLFKEEVEKLLTHQVGILEGYRISVNDGSKMLLQSINPDFIEKEIRNKKQDSGFDIGKLLPFAEKSKILDMIKENYKKYISDPYHIEKKFFRPAFLKGYQKSISYKSGSEY